MHSRQDDETLLTMLHMRDVAGLNCGDIGRHFGVSRRSIIGKLWRVDQAALPCECASPANKDGAMQPQWWAQ